MGWFRSTKRNWGLTVLAVWLILTGLLTFIGRFSQYDAQVLAALAIVAGVLLLWGR
jgi:hypothetical protein